MYARVYVYNYKKTSYKNQRQSMPHTHVIIYPFQESLSKRQPCGAEIIRLSNVLCIKTHFFHQPSTNPTRKNARHATLPLRSAELEEMAWKVNERSLKLQT